MNKDRQEGPHAHSINLDPANRFAFVADLGLDKVMIYKFDPAKGTLDEHRRGPFPLSVAVETTTPASWYADGGGTPVPVRVEAIGQGGLFVGNELSPAKEELLLDSCNWLLGRDDRLPVKNDPPWAYPRVALDGRGKALWQWGVLGGLPALFLLGLATMGLMFAFVKGCERV